MSTITVPCVVTAALACFIGTAEAATAYNSQRGSLEHDKNTCQATAYFPAGDCLSSYFADEGRDVFDQPPATYRPGHRLAYPRGPFPDESR